MTKHFSVRLDVAILQRLRKLEAKTNIRMARHMEIALTEYLDRRPDKDVKVIESKGVFDVYK